MSETNVFQLAQPGTFADSLTDVLREGARTLLAQAVEAEVADFLARHADRTTADGRRRIVRHGHLPERSIMTGIGPVTVRQPRVRDRAGDAGERIRFSPNILPRYARRTKSLEVLIPILYLKGVSTGDFEEALSALVGADAPGLSASTIARLKEAWSEEHERWRKRDLSAKRYVYWWVDGIYLEARLEDQAQCILVIIGATPEGKKELVGFADGVRESAESWRDLLLDLKRRGLSTAPQLAVADGALGFWKALGEIWPTTREQRCWVHKTANVLNKLPKSLHGKAKRALQEIWMAETKKEAVAAFDAFAESYAPKYDKAVECLTKDRDALLAFYDFPAEHWKHLRRRLVSERTAVINQIRGFLLERSIIVRQGLRFLRQLPDILAKRTDVLSPRIVRIVIDLAGDWRQLDERIETVTDEIETLAKSEDSCRRVMTVPGIGPIISSAMVAAIGSGVAFAKGRDFSAWLGLVPKQMSTGDRTILGRISKRGNGYLRMLFMQAARVILLRPANWPKHSFGVWLVRAAQRLHPNVLAAAKLARIAWTVLVQERSYQARVTKAAA